MPEPEYHGCYALHSLPGLLLHWIDQQAANKALAHNKKKYSHKDDCQDDAIDPNISIHIHSIKLDKDFFTC